MKEGKRGRGKAGLVSFLRESFAASGGTMPFERFMELALYDPDFGYYTKNIRGVGEHRSDFSTWAKHEELAAAIRCWLFDEWKCLFPGQRWLRVIEVGSGNGSLAHEIMAKTSLMKRRRIDYHIVEVSDPLRSCQKAKLRGRRVTWHSEMTEALAAVSGCALIFSNELPDAFPARWFRWNGNQWEEVFVRFSAETGVSEVYLKTDDPPKVSFANPIPTGQRVECHDSYRAWMGTWLPHWKQGAMLTIDYGGTVEEVYRRRPRGTMRAYFNHQRIDGPGIYQRFGRQDLTCDVSFDVIAKWGEIEGLQTVGCESMTEFLHRFNVPRGFNEQQSDEFQVLWQRVSRGPDT